MLPRVTKVTDPLEDFADVGEDERVTAGSNLRVLATAADLESQINPDAAATTKQEHADDCVGDEDGVVDPKKLSRRKVVSNVNKIVHPISLLPPNTIKYKSLLQKLSRTGLEWVKPQQDELDERAGAVRQEMKLMKGVLKHHQTGGLPEDRTLPGSKPFTVCLEFMESVTVKLMVNERAEMEVYPLILVCKATGIVHTQVAYDNSTSAFLDQ